MCAELGGELMRRRLMTIAGMEENELKEWVELENKTLVEDGSLNKKYDDSYDEYICYIELPVISEKINTAGSYIFGSYKIYYMSIGSTVYGYMIYVHIKRIADDFVLCEAANGDLSGVVTYPNHGIRILDKKSTEINCAFNFPAGTKIVIYGR